MPLSPSPVRPLSRRKSASASGDSPLPPFGPNAPPAFPAKFETHWFTQPRDHFNYFAPNSPTFEQRYLLDARHWAGPPAPIIMVPCVEAGPAPYYYGEYGWVIDTLAANLSALLVFPEHRGFGLTYPSVADGGDLNGWRPDAAHVGVLTEAQVLEDDTALATSLRFNLSAWDSPLIAVGGSLSGEMSTWWRIRYPFVVDMALAASAPIFGFPGKNSDGLDLCDQYGWYRVATEAFRSVGGDACVDQIRSGYAETSALSPADATYAFNTCTPATLPCHASQLADLVMDWTALAAELGSYPASNATRSQTVWACNQIKGPRSGVEAYAQLLAPQTPGECLDIAWSTTCATGDSRRRASVSATAGWCTTRWNDTSSGCQDGWGIESCTTEIHPINANNVTDFYPPSSETPADRQAGCRATYGSDLRTDGYAMPRSFGQIDLARMAMSASRIIFSSGSFDPWSSMSVKKTLAPTLPFVMIEGGAHHSDLGNNWNPQPTADDEPTLINARQFHVDTLNEWVKSFHEERRKTKATLSAA